MRNVLLTFLAVALAAMPAAAATTPAPGSPVRKAIFDALRPSVEAKIGPNVEFVATRLLVEGGWAFVQAEPRRKDGKPIDGQAYFPNDWEFMDGLTTTAILQFRNGRWNLVDSAIGATDAWYCGVPQVASFVCGR